jgi:predicted dinucleotide-binding enzyme
MNPYPESPEIIDLDSGITSAKEIAKQIPDARVVKAFNANIRENLTTNTGSLREDGRKLHPDAHIYNNPNI